MQDKHEPKTLRWTKTAIGISMALVTALMAAPSAAAESPVEEPPHCDPSPEGDWLGLGRATCEARLLAEYLVNKTMPDD